MRAYRLPVRGSGRNSVRLCALRISDPTFTSWGSSKPFPCGFDGHRNRNPRPTNSDDSACTRGVKDVYRVVT